MCENARGESQGHQILKGYNLELSHSSPVRNTKKEISCLSQFLQFWMNRAGFPKPP